MVVSQTMIIHIQKHVKSTLIVAMVIKSFVVIMTNTANQFRFIEVKMLYTNSWKNARRSQKL